MSETPRTNAKAMAFRRQTVGAVESAIERAESLEHELAEAPPDTLAGRLIDAWCADKGRQIPWAKAIQIVAIVTKQPDEERDRLLHLGDEDGACEMCGRRDAERSAAELIEMCAEICEQAAKRWRSRVPDLASESDRTRARDKAGMADELAVSIRALAQPQQ